MKKRKSLIFSLLLSSLILLGCSDNSVESSTQEEVSSSSVEVVSSSEESSEVISSSEVSSEVISSSEESSEVISSSEESSEVVSSSEEESSSLAIRDFVHDSNVRLCYDYKGKDFYKDGIGEMELKMVIDGDTAHFYPVVETTSSDPVKARYYGIDTPESTGKIQPYGHGASEFNKEKLQNAAKNGTIVVSTPTGLSNDDILGGENPYMAPKPDSTGSRYVSLVWINETVKNAPYDSLVCVNLWIVQAGFSWVKNVGDIPEYAQTFYDAEAQARAQLLNLFSGEDDPYMPQGDYQLVDLLEMKKEMERWIKNPDSEYKYDNKKLRVRGTVAGFANQTLYLATYFSVEEGARKADGEWAGINVYVGPAAIAGRFTIRNTVVELCGIMSFSENFGVQLSGVSFPNSTLKNKDTDARVIIKADDNTEEYRLEIGSYTPEQLNKLIADTDLECFNTAITLGTYDEQSGETNPYWVKCSSAYKASGSKAITIHLYDCNFDIYVPFTYKPTGDGITIWDDPDDYKNKRFYVTGVFAIHQSKNDRGYRFSYQINPSSTADLICLDI